MSREIRGRAWKGGVVQGVTRSSRHLQHMVSQGAEVQGGGGRGHASHPTLPSSAGLTFWRLASPSLRIEREAQIYV